MPCSLWCISSIGFLLLHCRMHHLTPNSTTVNQITRNFMCLGVCYPLLHPYGLHKLKFRFKPCIFLGYINGSYKCLDLVTNKSYLSKHVIFNEESLPAKDQVTTLLPSKINAQGDAPLLISVPNPFTYVLSTTPNHNVDSISNEPSPLAQTKPPSPTALVSLIMPSPTVHIFLNSNTTTPASSNLESIAPTSTLMTNSLHNSPPHPPHSVITRSRTGYLKPKDFSNFQLYHTSLPNIELVSYRKTAVDPRWREASNRNMMPLSLMEPGLCAQDLPIIISFEISGCIRSRRRLMDP
jgi:hypothetical protein